MQTSLLVITIVLAIIVGLLLGGILVYYFLTTSTKNISSSNDANLKFETKNTETKEVENQENTTQKSQEEINIFETRSLMSVEAKVKIIQNLEKFEESGLFTNKNLSLPYLAAHLETNTKYLSRVIKNYKHKDFNAYINKLRIDFILRQLNENKDFRYYKISSLADEAGYSSHSKFATIFKQIVGIPPSLYIQHLEIGKIPRDIPNMNIDNQVALSS